MAAMPSSVLPSQRLPIQWLPHQPPSADEPPSRPLVVTADPELLDDVLRLAAAAGVDVEVAADPVAARPSWARSPLVLVGDDVAAAMGRAGLRRRADVVLVGRVLGDLPMWQRALDIGAEHVAVLPDAEPWLISRIADSLSREGPRGVVVGVVGGRGGAGASTLAAALAVVAMSGATQTMLLDADPFGGGVDLMFGGEHAAGLRWPQLANSRGRLAGHELLQAVPCLGELAVLSWDRGDPLEVRPSAMSSVLAAARAVCGLVVVDLPRRLDDASQVAVADADVVLLVVPAEIRAAAAAARVAAQVTSLCDDVRVVVRGPAPGGLRPADVASALGLPLAGFIKPERYLAAALEQGHAPAIAPGPLRSFCRRFLRELLVSDIRRDPSASVRGSQ